MTVKKLNINILLSSYLLLLCFAPATILAIQNHKTKNEISLTAKEISWLADNRIIDIGVDGSWPPIDFMSGNEHRGIAADYLKLIENKLGITFKIHHELTFKEMLDKVRQGELKAGASIVKNDERAKDLIFTTPFFRTHKSIVSRKDRTDINGIESLFGKTVAIENGFSTMEQLQQLYPQINLLPVKSTKEALNAVFWNKADAYIGTRAVAQWLIQQEQLFNLHFSGNSGIGSSDQRFAIHKSEQLTPLASAMDKALKSIDQEEKQNILNHWLGSSEFDSSSYKFTLSQKERDWLKERGVLKIGIDNAWEPIEYVDESGAYQGISSDYMAYIKAKLDLRLDIVKELSWSEIVAAAKKQEIDILPALVETPERVEYLNFTEPYLDFPFVIFVTEQSPFITGLEDFKHRRVAIVDGYVTQEYLQRDFPDIELIPVDNSLEGLTRLSLNEVDAYVGNLTVGSHLIRKKGITNIKIGAPTPYKYELSIGVRKDWPEMIPILNRVIRDMTEYDKKEISQKWMALRYDVKVDYTRVWEVIGFATMTILLIVLLLIQSKRKHLIAKRNEEQLRQIINTVPLAIVVSDQKGRIQLANPHALKEIESDGKPITNMNMSIFYADPADRDAVRNQLSRKTHVYDKCLQIKTLKGNIIDGMLSAIPIRMNKQEMNLGILINLTQRIQMERRLEKAMDIAEQANRTKSEFLANMSHEIRTPMNAIIGLSHLALETELTEKQYDYLSKIKLSAHNLLGIINDVLDFSKVEAGKLEIDEIEFKMDSVMENLSSMIGFKADIKGLELIFKQDPDIPHKVIGDPLRIGQVLLNLVQNAIKFTPQGEILISVTLIEKSISNCLLKFSITDTGIGIEADKIQNLFDAFVQADASVSRRHGGTGLGLSISNNLVHLMGGELSASSQVDKGSTFEFTLPLGIAEEQSDRQFISNEDLQGMSVLLVEDNDTARHVMTEMLEAFSFHVTTASSADEAYGYIQSTSFRLILMDWRMPKTNGLEAIAYIREHLDADIKIILITAHDREELLNQVEAIKLDAVLIKPISPSTLFDAVHEVVTGQTKSLPTKSHISRRFRGNVLLVEDNTINQQVARELLEKLGLLVVIANNGEEAIEKIQQADYELVFMDIQMPGIDGLEATRRIRQDLCNTYTRIIAMTAHAMQGDKERCLAVGMDDYISKPIDPDKLSRMLLAWLPVDDRPIVDRAAKPAGEVELNLPRDLNGIDTEWGVKRVGGNERLYGKLLIEFFERYRDSGTQIHEFIKSGEDKALHRLLHTLQGVAGNLGAKKLQQASHELLAAFQEIKPESESNINLDNFITQAEVTFNSIRNIQQLISATSNSSNVQQLTSTSQLDDLCQQLTNAIKNGDSGSSNLLDQCAAQILTIKPDMAELISDLQHQIDNYEFEEAYPILRKIIDETGLSYNESE